MSAGRVCYRRTTGSGLRSGWDAARRPGNPRQLPCRLCTATRRQVPAHQFDRYLSPTLHGSLHPRRNPRSILRGAGIVRSAQRYTRNAGVASAISPRGGPIVLCHDGFFRQLLVHLLSATPAADAAERTRVADATIIRSILPNPFGSSTTVMFETPIETGFSVEVIDLRGRRIRTLVGSQKSMGLRSGLGRAGRSGPPSRIRNLLLPCTSRGTHGHEEDRVAEVVFGRSRRRRQPCWRCHFTRVMLRVDTLLPLRSDRSRSRSPRHGRRHPVHSRRFRALQHRIAHRRPACARAFPRDRRS